MKRSADISSDGRYRWRLERRWGDGTSVCWIMLNPSTADAEKDDPTIRRVITFSKAWGHDAAIVVNLFPFRSSDPREVQRWAEEKGHWQPTSWPPNMLAISEAADASAFIVCAWGAPTWARFRAKQVLGGLGQDYSLYCLGANADGSPKHPLARGRAWVPPGQKPLEFVSLSVVAGPHSRKY